MRKLSLLLSVLISFSTLVSFTYASSGDITIGDKVYTQEQAQKQIVESLLNRIEKQKVAKVKARIVTLTLRQYTNRLKTAQKQGKTDLVKFYDGIINTIKGKMNTTNIESTNSTENTTNTNITSSQNVVNTYTVDGMTFSLTTEQKKDSEAKVMSMKSGFCGDKGDFLMLMKQNGYSNASYEYHFASTLSYQEYVNGKMTCSVPYNSNHGGLGTTSDQTGLSGTEYEQAKIQGNVMTYYYNFKDTITKAQFLEIIAKDYGGVNSYAYQFAQTLSFSK